jgi:hypothetical protein
MRALVLLSIALVLLLLGVAGAGRYLGPARQMARVRELRDDLRSEAVRNLPDDERRDRWRQFGEEMKKLTEEQRNELGQEREQEFLKEVASYFTLSRPEQVAYLDRQIDRMEAGRKRWEAARAARAVQKAKEESSGAAPSPSAGPKGRGDRPPATAEEKDRRRRDRLDRHTPEQRAQLVEYRRQFDARRQQRGLPASPWGR